MDIESIKKYLEPIFGDELLFPGGEESIHLPLFMRRHDLLFAQLQGITVVLITHFMEEAVLADRVVVMNNGKIELDGTPEYVFSEVDLLKSIGLEVPASKELLYMLNNKGVDIDISALNEEKCVEIITKYLRRENNE